MSVRKMVFMVFIVAEIITFLSNLRILVPVSAMEEENRETIVENIAA